MTRARRGTKVRQWEDGFLEAFQLHANVSAAAKAAGVSRNTIYARRRANPEFAALFNEAEQKALDNLELCIYKGALEGDLKAAMWFLSRRRPEKWGDRMALEHTGADGGPIQTSVGVDVKWHDPDPEANREPAELGETPS